MKPGKTISVKSKNASLLSQRIAENVAAQEINLVDWIFSKIEVKLGSHVLELCAGTGTQTLRLLDLVGAAGHITAVDISQEALNTLTSAVECVDASWLPRLATIETNIDEIGKTLSRAGLTPHHFDLIFCAYGLYYSSSTKQVLREAKLWLRPKGVIVIVGPFGQNNIQLFEFLRQNGVDIPPFAKYSSQNYMYREVVPWVAENFQSVKISTVVNRVRWTMVRRILNYWKNSTFYKEEKLSIVKSRIKKYFESNPEFVNEKWIMMVEATDARP